MELYGPFTNVVGLCDNNAKDFKCIPDFLQIFCLFRISERAGGRGREEGSSQPHPLHCHPQGDAGEHSS